MFITEHLEGRLRYETNKVVCIDVYLITNLYSNSYDLKNGEFITQVLLSLVNKKYHVNDSSKFRFGKRTFYGNTFNEIDFLNELDTGISNYLEVREKLELDYH